MVYMACRDLAVNGECVRVAETDSIRLAGHGRCTIVLQCMVEIQIVFTHCKNKGR